MNLFRKNNKRTKLLKLLILAFVSLEKLEICLKWNIPMYIATLSAPKITVEEISNKTFACSFSGMGSIERSLSFTLSTFTYNWFKGGWINTWLCRQENNRSFLNFSCCRWNLNYFRYNCHCRWGINWYCSQWNQVRWTRGHQRCKRGDWL